MNRTTYSSPFEAALHVLPEHIADAVLSAAALYGGKCNEIRLCRGGQAYITVQGNNVRTSVICTDADLAQTLSALCGHSLYAHSDTIREGYIFTDTGLRVGVCGRAVCKGGDLEMVSDISSLSIRIPLRCIGAADTLYPFVKTESSVRGMLIWSAPGVGKTTALRELAFLLSGGEQPVRVAVIDTRFELTAGIEGGLMDVFSGYPRDVGMEIAVRTMSPQVVLCDEIAGTEDARAIRKCAAAGVAVVASAHGGTMDDIFSREELRDLIDGGVFPTLAGLYRSGGSILHRITNASGEILPCCG